MMSHLLRDLSKLFQNGEDVACDKEALDQVPADKDALAIRSQLRWVSASIGTSLDVAIL